MELARAASRTRAAAVLLASGFGLGLSPAASGTVGTLPGLLLMALLRPCWDPLVPGSLLAQGVAVFCLAVLAAPLCGAAESHYGRKDDGRIVADEYLTFPIGLLGLPLTPGVLALAFFTNRVFDVLKPYPADRLQRLPGGLGIVADDVVAALYSLAVNHLVVRLVEWSAR